MESDRSSPLRLFVVSVMFSSALCELSTGYTALHRQSTGNDSRHLKRMKGGYIDGVKTTTAVRGLRQDNNKG